MSQILTAFSRIPIIGRLALGAAVVLGLGSLYVTLQSPGNPDAAASCEAAGNVSAAMAKAAIGEVAAFQVHKEPRRLPDLSFHDHADKVVTLASMQGKVILLNLWATWCAPCRKEMPALDALQSELGGKTFDVVAVNIDTRHPDKPRAWLVDNNITKLAYYSDPEAKVFQDLKRIGQVVGMPTTLLIDAKGCQLGVLHGPAEWHSADAKRLISAAMGR